MKIFLDVGAHIGETVKIALEDKYGFDKLYCFEPVPECAAAIMALEDKRVMVCEYGLWDQNCVKPLYDPKSLGASVFRDKFGQRDVSSQNVKFVRASDWFSQNLKVDDQVYLKLNCEGAECVILDDLIQTGEWRKIDVAMIDFDVLKIPSQRHLASEMKAKLNKLGIPKIFYTDEYNPGNNSGEEKHNFFTHSWLNDSMKNNLSGIKIINGLKLRGNPAEIPDCSRDDLPQFFVGMGFKVGAEIGVYKGEFSEKIAKTGLKLFSVDPYFRDQEKFERMYQDTKQLLAPYPNCEIVRKTSMEAVRDFEDESLDFVYIDANHEFRYIAEDLSEWTKKVRKGGIVAGHDYFYQKPSPANHWHVAIVLNAYVEAFGIENWYLLGRKNALLGEKRDKWRSWMFVKQ